MLNTIRTVADLRVQVAAWKKAGLRVAMVPTMGALHEGHLSLVRLAREKADRVVTSIFVNPTQFAPHEDFDAYPRAEARDAGLLDSAGCHVLYAPTAAEMYPDGFATSVSVTGVSEPLDGKARPHHFGGVATVVAKLLNQCGPDLAIFGEKDYQQLLVIRRLVRDLDLPVEIVGAPTARDHDGLALSSRNAYLSAEQRQVASALPRILKEAATTGSDIEATEKRAADELLAAGFDKVDYVEFRDGEDLTKLSGKAEAGTRIFVAAWLGKTRLIDNMAV
ncbi:MAG TPA: pantoate--beta-alanine ligase [Caulobacteraceae bacterium]|nr:pantoate--beta-alanine ligase [Caulobacteraceae bacterium]